MWWFEAHITTNFQIMLQEPRTRSSVMKGSRGKPVSSMALVAVSGAYQKRYFSRAHNLRLTVSVFFCLYVKLIVTTYVSFDTPLEGANQLKLSLCEHALEELMRTSEHVRTCASWFTDKCGFFEDGCFCSGTWHLVPFSTSRVFVVFLLSVRPLGRAHCPTSALHAWLS